MDSQTLTRFFMLHFLLPFVLSALVLIHIVCLHSKGSSNPLGVRLNIDKVEFDPYFKIKDLFGVFVIAVFAVILNFWFP